MPSSLNIPNSFTAGTDAVAAQVNANFDAVIDYLDDNMVAKDGTVAIAGTQTVNNLTVTGTLTTSGDISATVDTLKGEVLADNDVIVLQNGATAGSGWFKGDIQDSSGTTIVDVSAATFNGDITGNAATVTEATNVAVSASSGTSGQIAIIDATTSPQGIKYDTALDWNSSSNILNVAGEVQCTILDVNGSADISGEVQCTILDVNGSADISGALTVSGTTNSSGITNSGGDITNANNYFQSAGVIRNNADQDWALRVGNDAAVTTPDNKAVVAVVWDNNHGSAANMGMSLMFNESASTKTFLKFQYATGIDGGSIQSNGTTTTLNNPSDIRYKENITSVSGAVDALKGVDVISYNRIGHNVTRVGFSAQNVQSIPEFAEFVRTEEGDEDARLHLAESEFVPYLVKAVQELTSRLETLEAA